MGVQQSPVQSIESKDFKAFPKDRVVAGRFVEVEGVRVLQDAKGQLYTNATPLNKKAYCSGSWHWSRQLVKALDLLGLLSAEDKAKHEAYLAQEEKHTEVVSTLGDIKRSLERETLSPACRRALTKDAVRLWDSAPYRTQVDAAHYGYQPPGTTVKPEDSK